jgi:hypothetical protein
VFLRSEFRVVTSVTISTLKTMLCSYLPPVVCRRAHVVFTLFVFVCVWWCPTHIVLYFLFCLSWSCVLCVASFFDCLFLVALSVFSNVYLTIKISASPRPETCIVEHLILLLSNLITFCLFSEFARNSSFFYLKHIC